MEKRGYSLEYESFFNGNVCNHGRRSHFLVFLHICGAFYFQKPPRRVIKMFVTLFGPEMQMFVNNTCL